MFQIVLHTENDLSHNGKPKDTGRVIFPLQKVSFPFEIRVNSLIQRKRSSSNGTFLLVTLEKTGCCLGDKMKAFKKCDNFAPECSNVFLFFFPPQNPIGIVRIGF